MFESEVELKLADCPEQTAAIVRETIQNISSLLLGGCSAVFS